MEKCHRLIKITIFLRMFQKGFIKFPHTFARTNVLDISSQNSILAHLFSNNLQNLTQPCRFSSSRDLKIYLLSRVFSNEEIECERRQKMNRNI